MLIIVIGRPWTIQELRRKSFEDLHTIWYTCVKERNILERESRIYGVWGVEDNTQDPFAQQSLKVRDTMWRIRHVLSERQTSWENSLEDYKTGYERIMLEFEDEYLEADDSQDAEMEARLERFQFAYFGITSELSSKNVNYNVIRGIKKVASLKFNRFQSTLREDSQISDGPIDIKESFLIFVAPHTPEGIQDAVDTIISNRKTNPEPIPKKKENKTLASLLKAYENLGSDEKATAEATN